MKPKTRSSFSPSIVLTLGSIFACTTLVQADQTWTGATSADWNTATNWTSAVPTASDVARFDATSTANLATTLGANASVAGVSVTSPAAAVSVTAAANSALSPFAAITAAAATDVFTYTAANAHPLVNGDQVAFTGTLPTGITAAGSYFVVNASVTTFQVSATAGGAPLNFTTDSAAMFVDGLILAANATDTFTFGAAFYYAPFPNGSLVSFTAGTGPAGLTMGANYYVINSTATSFQVATAPGGFPVDITTDGLTVRAFPNNTPQLRVGGSGFDLSAATFGLTVASPVVSSNPQTWSVATGQTLTLSGATLGSGLITKNGAGSALLTNSNQFPAGVRVSAGSLITRNGLALLNSPVTLENGSTYRFETVTGAANGSGATTFQGHPITVAPGASATITTNSAGNGYSGLVSGFENTVLNIGAVGALTQCSFGAAGTAAAPNLQFDNFYGIVRITDGASLRFSATSLYISATRNVWDTGVSGNISTRNGGTVRLGELRGTGTLTGAGGAAGTATFVIGELGTDSVFGGTINSGNITDRIAALTKAGSGRLSLSAAQTYTGATNVSAGILEFNNAKSGLAANNVAADATLGGSGSLAGNTTVPAKGRLAPGDSSVADGVGTLTVSNLNLATGSVLDLEFAAGGANDKLVIAAGSTLAFSQGVVVNPTLGKTANGTAFTTNGSYPIIGVAGATVTGFNSSALTVPDNGSGKSYTFTNDGTNIVMVVSDSTADPTNYWVKDGDGTWNLAANWSKGSVPNAAKAIAKFGQGSTYSTSPDVTLDGNRTVGEITFNDAFGAVVTIAQGSSGTLLLDNGTSPSSIVSIAGNHVITAPVSVDTEGVAVDVAATFNTVISGVIGGAGSVTKSGPGLLTLSGANTFNAGLILQGGNTRITTRPNLGAGTVTFSGGTLSISSDLAGDTTAYKISGASSASFDTNSFTHTLVGGIVPAAGATGGLTKVGLGTLILAGPFTYPGATLVSAGDLVVDTGGSIAGGPVNTTLDGGGLVLLRNGGTVTATTGNLAPSTRGLFMDVASGNVSFSGTLSAVNTSQNGNSAPIRVTSGVLNGTTIQLGRTGVNTSAEPINAPVDTNLYITGGSVNLSADLNIGAFTSNAPNSTVVTRVDGGTLTVAGAISIGINNTGRWSYLDLNGGTLVNTGAVVDSGVVLGGPLPGSSAFLVRAGKATVERIQFGRGAVTGQGLLKMTGGELYVGSGGIPLGTTGVFTSEIRLAGGTLAATADWTSPIPTTLGGGTIKAADASGVPHNITLAGAISGTDLTKTGGGILTLGGTNIYTGTTTVTAGTLRVDGNGSAAVGAVNVAAGATLGGIGTVGGAVTVSGSVAPGSPTGTLTVPSAVFGTGSALEIVLDGSATPQNGKLVATGALDITNAKLKFTSSGVLTQPVYVIAHYGSLVGTQFASIENLPAGATINYHHNNGVDSNNIAITVPVTTSGYASWASTNGLTAANNGATQDPDNDGIANLMEFVLGGNPLASSSAILPVQTLTATDFVFTFKRSDDSEAEAAVIFDWGTTLAAWPNNVTIGAASSTAANGVTVTVDEAAGNPDTITVKVPRSNAADGKLFGRIKAVK